MSTQKVQRDDNNNDNKTDMKKSNNDDDFKAKYQGVELFEKIATRSIETKQAARDNRCPKCWHDKTLRCICPMLQKLLTDNGITTDASALPLLKLPNGGTIKALILMHYKEYLSAGDDAKLLLTMLPSTQVELFIFGREGDWERFASEVSMDPTHTVTLWPGDGALTIQEYIHQLPNDSPWNTSQENTTSTAIPAETNEEADTNTSDATNNSISTESNSSTLRVIVLDGVYQHARNMFKSMKQRLGNNFPPYVALHPTTLSVYHRAQKNYATASAVTTLQSENPKALHICTVEAFALMIQELQDLITTNDDTAATTTTSQLVKALVQAVQINNDALVHAIHVRPDSGKPTSTTSGAAKRSRRKQERRQQQQQNKETSTAAGNN